MERFIGIDVGAEAVKLVELVDDAGSLRWTRRHLVEHHKRPVEVLREVLSAWRYDEARAAAVTGRLSRQVALARAPTKQAELYGYRFLFGEAPATIVNIGSHGFSVLELHGRDNAVFRENSRCSQGTGNFLRQLVERFELGVDEAALLVENEPDPAPLSGRCPVILKTDMTHLANLGEPRAKILAGLFDAVCENVQVLLKPGISPPALLLVGGVMRSLRVRAHFARYGEKNGMTLLDTKDDDALYLEALGAACIAAKQRRGLTKIDALFAPAEANDLERLPPLAASLARVRRLTRPPLDPGSARRVVLGLDIGSTGSKAVAIATSGGEALWEGYLRTNGNPVAAAQGLVEAFLAGPAAHHLVVGFGVTGSGREIVGSLLATCYGHERVYVLNEIAAHARGALHHDERVDTIFEIGGQDAKYIRLSAGRIVDAAMNEACSAGTGSFIEEQGKRFSGITSVSDLAQTALNAPYGVALGQHCSVFMAEIVDEAVAAGVEQSAIMAGLYDSIIQNYLNRVKGTRSLGEVIFCQGMPFAAPALAAAVARQTHATVIVPPNPGTIGALGIALLAAPEIAKSAPLALARFLAAKITSKDSFVCKSIEGCGGAGNKCRIDRLRTVVGEEQKTFTWGGSCSLYDKGTRKQKLPARAPDPFARREKLIAALAQELGESRGLPKVALTDEFQLKGLSPFFATFIYELGFDLVTYRGADRAALKRGILGANVPFCAPMQQIHGLSARMADSTCDYIFFPMLRELPKVAAEPISVVCPLMQGSPDIIALDLARTLRGRLVSPVLELGDGPLGSAKFRESCRVAAKDLGVDDPSRQDAAFDKALAAMHRFDAQVEEFGREAVRFCAAHGVTPVVVLGRNYTIYNQVLNSNVPALLREQGALAIPVDCYPVDQETPSFVDMFWGQGQRILRAAHTIRRTEGTYSLFCSNYSCGPDSFTAHFYSYIMEGKPSAIIETDGHCGDAGTKTRIEAFLHCVRQDLDEKARRAPTSLVAIEKLRVRPRELRHSGERVLIPRMGPGAEALAAALSGFGIAAEALPRPDRDALNIGRRYTSGKECAPMVITLGSLLQRLERERESDERFVFLMPGSRGPCRFGAYKTLHKIVLERLGYSERVRVWSPPFDDYFEDLPGGFAVLCFTTLMAADLLLEAYQDVLPVEQHPGAARAIYNRYQGELNELLRELGGGDLSVGRSLAEVAAGRLYGITDLLARAAASFALIKQDRVVPNVLVVGEIYMRCDPFANDFVIDKLAERGIRARLAPMSEWIEYSDHIGWFEGRKHGTRARLASRVQQRVRQVCYATLAKRLGWPQRTSVEQSIAASGDYVRKKLEVESVLTLGAPLEEWRHGHIDAVLSVGPLECMPNKIAESQYFHVAVREGLLSLTLSLTGDPVDQELIDSFAFEVHARHRARKQARIRRSDTEPAWARARAAVYALRAPLEKLAAMSPWPLPFARRAEDDRG